MKLVRTPNPYKANVVDEITNMVIGFVQGTFNTGFESVFHDKVIARHGTRESAAVAVEVEWAWYDHGVAA